MTSPINWALLGLVIERPSYAYELARRFERTFDGALSLSSTSQIYSALDALSRRALIEELAGSGDARQPKPRYRATEDGLVQFEARLIEQVHEGRRRQRLLILQLAALSRRPNASDVLDRYERAWRDQASAGAAPGGDQEDSGCLARLLAEERRLTTEAALSWVRGARNELGERGR